MPATRGLIPDVDGKRDVLRRRLWDRDIHRVARRTGADVVGVDASDGMLDQAEDRVGDRADLRHGDLAEPWTSPTTPPSTGSSAPLALGYVEDWDRPFSEFARVLKPGGFVVFSVLHPLDTLDEDANYFDVEVRAKDWSVEVPFYRRPFGEMVNPVVESGLRIDEVVEPQPTAAFREKRPEWYEKESRRPVFLCVRAVKP